MDRLKETCSFLTLRYIKYTLSILNWSQLHGNRANCSLQIFSLLKSGTGKLGHFREGNRAGGWFVSLACNMHLFVKQCEKLHIAEVDPERVALLPHSFQLNYKGTAKKCWAWQFQLFIQCQFHCVSLPSVFSNWHRKTSEETTDPTEFEDLWGLGQAQAVHAISPTGN